MAMLFVILKITNVFISTGDKRQSAFTALQTIFKITQVDTAICIGIGASAAWFVVLERTDIFMSGQLGIRTPNQTAFASFYAIFELTCVDAAIRIGVIA